MPARLSHPAMMPESHDAPRRISPRASAVGRKAVGAGAQRAYPGEVTAAANHLRLSVFGKVALRVSSPDTPAGRQNQTC